MNLTELETKIADCKAREAEVIARQEATTTDALRFECERMVRLIQVARWAFLCSLERELARDHIGQPDRPAVSRQTAA